MRSAPVRSFFAMAMTSALHAGACSSIINPTPPQDPDRFELSERRAERASVVADPDPVPLSAWQFGAADAGAPSVPSKASKPGTPGTSAVAATREQ